MLGTLSSHIYPAHATGCSCWSLLSSADVCNYSERISAENLWPNVFAEPSCNMLYSPYCLVTGSKRMPKTWNEWEVEGSMLASKCRWTLLKWQKYKLFLRRDDRRSKRKWLQVEHQASILLFSRHNLCFPKVTLMPFFCFFYDPELGFRLLRFGFLTSPWSPSLTFLLPGRKCSSEHVATSCPQTESSHCNQEKHRLSRKTLGISVHSFRWFLIFVFLCIR